MDGSGFWPATDERMMISLFLEVAVGQTEDTARQYLQATRWKLEEAIQLFYLRNEFGEASSSSSLNNEVSTPHQSSWFDDELGCPGVWEADEGSTSAAAETYGDNLASLYRPPFALMYHGSFQKAKEAAEGQDRWLLVNVQSTREFSSHMLNRDTWGNEIVAHTITSSFIFWQVSDDTEEGSKIITFYKLDTLPATLVIDPITGQKMRLWRGMIQPETLLEDVLQFTDSSPKDHIFSLSHRRPRKQNSHASTPKIQDEINEDDEELKLAQALSIMTVKDISEVDDTKEDTKEEKRNYPTLPEEPKGDKSLLCRVGVRFPDGSRAQRNFLRTDPIQLLWSFCAAKCGDEKPFRLAQAIPGAVKDLDYDSSLTFDESGVANSMISVIWE